MFSGERAESVSFAAITVSIPPDSVRKVGTIQWPTSLPGDARRDFVTVSANYLERRQFDTAIAAAATGSRKVVVFVHGFNNRFDDAVYRFAQITHDSKIEQIPVLFTWPSKGEMALRAYTYDRESANYSRDALEELLDMLSRHPGVSEVTVVAHSMGNWVTRGPAGESDSCQQNYRQSKACLFGGA
jgi:esterase/lipase superfamily enzyme